MKGTIRIGNKLYPVEVRNGTRYIDGKTIDKFMDGLTFNDKLELAMLGERVKNKTLKTSPQTFIDAIEKTRDEN